MDFIYSWAFAFIIGCFIGAAIGFFTAAILAASSRASMDDYVYCGRHRGK